MSNILVKPLIAYAIIWSFAVVFLILFREWDEFVGKTLTMSSIVSGLFLGSMSVDVRRKSEAHFYKYLIYIFSGNCAAILSLVIIFNFRAGRMSIEEFGLFPNFGIFVLAFVSMFVISFIISLFWREEDKK